MEDGRDGVGEGEGGGLDDVVGETAIEGVAKAEAEIGGGGVGEVGTGGGGRVEGLEKAAIEEDGEGGVEEDGDGAGGLFDEEAIAEGFGSAAAEGEDGVGAGEGAGEGAGLQPAEVWLAEGGEDLGDGDASEIFDEVIEIEEVPTDAIGEDAADGGLAGAHETGEDNAGHGGREGGERGFGGFDREGLHDGLR
jgi:hypothetical protein